MKCERCKGKGMIATGLFDGEHFYTDEEPCPECDGSGFSHCCEGICEQPESETPSDTSRN
jgi:DnaJ-class molecular chaperone